MFSELDWQMPFLPSTPLVETFVRGTIIYPGLLVLLRLLRREAGTVSTPDLLVLVLVADAAQNTMAGDYTSVTDGLLLVATIIGWSFLVNWLGFQIPAVGRFVHPPPLALVEDGKFLFQNMRAPVRHARRAYEPLAGAGNRRCVPSKESLYRGRRAYQLLPLEGQVHQGSDREGPV
jgi:hypothetical protein